MFALVVDINYEIVQQGLFIFVHTNRFKVFLEAKQVVSISEI